MMEADVTRGKLAAARKHWLTVSLRTRTRSTKNCDRCLLCGSCQANCPSGVSILEIFMEARAIVAAYKGLSPLKKAIFRTLLPNPKLFGFLLKIGAPFQGLAMRDDDNAQGTATCSPLLRPFLGERHMQPLAKQTLSAKIGAVNSPAGKSRCKVAFFPGCHGRQDLHQRLRSLPQSVRLPRESASILSYQLFLLRHSRPLVRRPCKVSKRWSCTTWTYSEGPGSYDLHRHAVFVVYGCHPRVSVAQVLRQPARRATATRSTRWRPEGHRHQCAAR